VDLNTAHLRICELKKFFAGIRRLVPFYTSPFEIMSETLNRKLGRATRRRQTKRDLSKAELQTVLAWLRQDTSIQGLENHALVLMLASSGLRAAELCQLVWGGIAEEEGCQVAHFTGKGGQPAE